MKICIFLISLLAVNAFAYIPPSAFVVKSVTAKRQGPKAIRIRGIVSGFKKSSPADSKEELTGISFKHNSLIDFGKNLMRVRIFDSNDQLLFVTDRKIEHPGTVALIESGASNLANTLRGLSIPSRSERELMELKTEEERRALEVMSITRFKTQVAWVIGPLNRTGAPEPQFWVEKDTFLPLKLIWKHENKPIELRFENYKYIRDFPFPRVTTAYQYKGDQPEPLFKDDFVDGSITPDLGDWKTQVTVGFTSAGESSSGEIKELIQKYLEWIR